MSVRSFLLLAIASVGLLFGGGVSVLANTCGYACQATYTVAGGACAPGTATDNCPARCASVCAGLTGGAAGTPAPRPDAASPSTCSGSTCTPCSCIPQVEVRCEATDAAACTTSCRNTCSRYTAAPGSGIQAVGCRESPAPTCAAPAPVAGAAAAATDAGFCRYSCQFGATQPVHTQTACTGTQGSRASCPIPLANETCTRLNMDTTAIPGSEEPVIVCGTGGGVTGPHCIVSCTRRMAVSASEAGTCLVSGGDAATEGARCQANCDRVCGARGMRCGSGVNCSGAPSAEGRGQCHFSCVASNDPISQDDRAATCSATNTEASTIACAQRCTTSCREQGGGCVSQPAAVCVAPPSSGGNTNGAPNTQASNNPSRTAPAFSVEFPDPFGGRLNLPQILGNIIRIIVGLCGVLFLGVFVYGGMTYMMSAGSPKKVAQGQAAIVNAIIGLTVVLLSYVAVSLVIQLSNTVQGSATAPASTLPSGGIAPGGTTRPTGRSSQGTSTPPPGGATDQAGIAGTPESACRDFYQADPATCAASRGGNCPNGVTNIESLIRVWGSTPTVPDPGVSDPMAACRQCLQSDIQGRLTNLYPGITESCVPALVNTWSTTCNAACNPNAITQMGGRGSTADVCALEGYNTTNSSCVTCMNYWQLPENLSTIDSVNCLTQQSRAAVWCATAESSSQLGRGRRSQSGGSCTTVAR